MKNLNLALILTAAILFHSCKATYYLKYSTEIVSPEAATDLTYQDSLFNMTFLPAPNGISFSIENKTNTSAYLVWDDFYIVYPNGNSFQALNLDILNTDARVREKENFESIIPRKSTFSRFTTSAQNLNRFEQFYSATVFNSALNSINTSMTYSELFSHDSYWKIEEVISYDNKINLAKKESKFLNQTSKWLIDNNNLGLGFRINNENEELYYDFRFQVNEVLVSRKRSGDYSYKHKILSIENDFQPIDYQEGPVQTNFSHSQSQTLNAENDTTGTIKVGDKVKIINYFNTPVDGKVIEIQNGKYIVEYTNSRNKIKQAKVLDFQVEKIE